MYHHLSVNASQLLCANLPVNKNMGDILAAECALFTGCSDVMLINIDAFASFSTLYLFVSDILLTHTHTHSSDHLGFFLRARVASQNIQPVKGFYQTLLQALPFLLPRLGKSKQQQYSHINQ